jgi:ArsR family transcriptional regulator
MNKKRWTRVFKGLANENRLKIIEVLYPNKELSVSDVRDRLKISYKWTSKNLVDLEKINILQSRGAKGRVFYSIHPHLLPKVREVIKQFLSSN